MKLIIASGPNKGAIFDVPEGSCTLGRAHANQIVLYDRRASARHAAIEPTDGAHTLRDLGSSNGTYVNGRLVAFAELKPGDLIQVGDTVLAFEHLPPDECEAPFRVVRDTAEGTAAIRATVPRTESSALPDPRATAVDVGELREDRRKLLALYRVNTAIDACGETRELLARVLEEIFDVLRADRGFVMLLDERTGDLLPAAMRRRHAAEATEEVAISPAITHQVIDVGEAVLTTEASDPGAGRSTMCAPLHGRQRLQGIIYLDAPAARPFSARDLQLLTVMANQLGVAIENARLLEARLADERFAAIGQAIAGLSHYIKNILGCMQGGAQILQRGLDEDDRTRLLRGWDILRRNERKISELVLDMLNYSGAPEPLLDPVQVNDLVDEVAESLGADAEKEFRVERDLAPDLPVAQLDSTAIHRCLLDLLSNAIEALPNEGGVVHLITRHDPAEQMLRISVADNGCGIEPEFLPRIFDAFVTTKGAKGTGLGLAVVDKLAKEHGGRVEVESERGRGSTFTLVLPVQPGPAGRIEN